MQIALTQSLKSIKAIFCTLRYFTWTLRK